MSLPAGSRSPATISYLDAGNEIGVAKFHGKTITAANHDAQVALWSTLLSATDAITLGARLKDTYNDETTYLVSKPTNGAAREYKLLVQMRNSVTGRRWTFTVPTLDPTVPSFIDNISARDAIELTTPQAIADFITAVEAFVVDPLAEANAVAVIGLKAVGRNI